MSFEELKVVVRADLFRHRGRTGWREFRHVFFTSACFHVIVLLRVRDFCDGRRVIGPLSAWAFAWCSSRRAIEIPRAVVIGPGFVLLHAGSFSVVKGTRIGRNCTVTNHASIGVVFRGEHEGVPTIGDDVYLGAYSCVFGRISVGNDVLVTAHAVVTRDVPDRAVVGGAPARVLGNDGAGIYVKHRVGPAVGTHPA
jgi:serine O-acetyltransferase